MRMSLCPDQGNQSEHCGQILQGICGALWKWLPLWSPLQIGWEPAEILCQMWCCETRPSGQHRDMCGTQRQERPDQSDVCVWWSQPQRPKVASTPRGTTQWPPCHMTKPKWEIPCQNGWGQAITGNGLGQSRLRQCKRIWQWQLRWISDWTTHRTKQLTWGAGKFCHGRLSHSGSPTWHCLPRQKGMLGEDGWSRWRAENEVPNWWNEFRVR